MSGYVIVELINAQIYRIPLALFLSTLAILSVILIQVTSGNEYVDIYQKIAQGIREDLDNISKLFSQVEDYLLRLSNDAKEVFEGYQLQKVIIGKQTEFRKMRRQLSSLEREFKSIQHVPESLRNYRHPILRYYSASENRQTNLMIGGSGEFDEDVTRENEDERFNRSKPLSLRKLDYLKSEVSNFYEKIYLFQDELFEFEEKIELAKIEHLEKAERLSDKSENASLDNTNLPDSNRAKNNEEFE